MTGSTLIDAVAGGHRAVRRLRRAAALALLLLTIGLVVAPAPPPAIAQAASQAGDPFPDDIVDPRASTNGCGSQGEDGIDVPDAPYPGVSFTPGCDWHDQCYGTKGLTQSYCDLGMYAKMVDACDGATGCSEVAAAYHLAVSTLGGEPYRDGQRDACQREPTRGGRAHGDPHVVTLDGLSYSVMTAGEFTLLRSADGTDLVQARFFPTSDTFSVITGLGVRIGDDVVTVDLDPETNVLVVAVDGVPVDASLTALAGGFVDLNEAVRGANRVVSLWARPGMRIDAVVHDGRIDLNVSIRESAAGDLAGLMGDGDGDPTNDLVDADTGEVLDTSDTGAPSFVRGIYDSGFAESWRVDPDASMFTPTDAFDFHGEEARSWPLEVITLEDFLGPEVEQVRARCLEAGLEGDAVTSCMFDVLASGDDGYVETSATSALRATAVDQPALVTARSGSGVLDDGADELVAADVVPTSPLVAAILVGDVEEVRRLLGAGEPVDVVSEAQGITPLGAALLLGDAEAVRLLLDAGADPELTLPDGIFSSVSIAATSGSTELVALLLDAGADPDGPSRDDADVLTPLVAGARYPDVVQQLLDAGADPDRIVTGLTPLGAAASAGALESAQLLVAAGARVDLDADDGPGARTPLVFAVTTGQRDMVEYLLGLGADPAVEVSPGTPLRNVTFDPEIRALLGG